MHNAKQWTVTLDIDEHDGQTRAVARLHTRDERSLKGVGLARRNPADHDVPEIGDELAAARALGDLTGHLLRTVADDLEAVTAPARAPERSG